MKISVFLVCMFLYIKTFGCVCAPLSEFHNKEDLKSYNFIALAEVESLSPIDPKLERFNIRINGDMHVKVLELFKGNTDTVVTDPAFKSDCALSVSVGQQWLFFGNQTKNGTIAYSCSYSVLYRDANGLRDWFYFRGIDRLDRLRTIYEKPLSTNFDATVNYANGKPEIIQSFKNGKLNGKRRFYYPSGQLYLAEQFKNGQRTGRRKVYSTSGQLVYDERYGDGYIKKKTSYFDTTFYKQFISSEAQLNADLLFHKRVDDSLILRKIEDSIYNAKIKGWKISYSRDFTDKGKSYKSKGYNHQGVVISVGYVDYAQRKSEWYHYKDDGTLEYYTLIDANKNKEIEYDYDKTGKRRDFVKACESCKFYFDERYATEGKPEPVYLQ